eukprot:TRINITY_DN12107_c0_g1_i3.p1 TRINITY_DN12107_c0_g1~~TRINITY_DN12107_c0_g1_i3.p1  ORF type:complete len:300 (-),score=48.73 TRINITY_DN12107_c0_g1_i3:189-1007(-)
MLAHRPLVWSFERCKKDYTPQEAHKIINTFDKAKLSSLLCCTNWPGIGTRWQTFFQWVMKQPNRAILTPREAFSGFAQFLGRVTSYRALSLTESQFKTIKSIDSVWPTGRLKAAEGKVNQIVETFGVRHVAHARLYIGLRLVPLDPSLSLHDDPETAVTIAGGYLDCGRKVYLLGLNVPKIEHLGYLVKDVQVGDDVWFEHRGVWFNTTWERTERFCLYEIPFLSERLVSLKILETNEEVEEFIKDFAIDMKQKREKWLKDTEGDGEHHESQ